MRNLLVHETIVCHKLFHTLILACKKLLILIRSISRLVCRCYLSRFPTVVLSASATGTSCLLLLLSRVWCSTSCGLLRCPVLLHALLHLCLLLDQVLLLLHGQLGLLDFLGGWALLGMVVLLLHLARFRAIWGWSPRLLCLQHLAYVHSYCLIWRPVSLGWCLHAASPRFHLFILPRTLYFVLWAWLLNQHFCLLYILIHVFVTSISLFWSLSTLFLRAQISLSWCKYLSTSSGISITFTAFLTLSTLLIGT